MLERRGPLQTSSFGGKPIEGRTESPLYGSRKYRGVSDTPLQFISEV